MTPERDHFEDDLEPTVKGRERRSLLGLAERLSAERPVPRPGFRSEFRSRLLSRDEDGGLEKVRTLVFGYAVAGSLMLVVAAAGLAGTGPFAV